MSASKLFLFEVVSLETNEFYFALVPAETREEAGAQVQDRTCKVIAVYETEEEIAKELAATAGLLVFNDDGTQRRKV